MIVVSNTSPITNLAAIAQLSLLQNLYGNIIIPNAVFRELTEVESAVPGTQEVQALDWIQTRQVTDSVLVVSLQEELDAGEAEAIALAFELRADLLLLDERRGYQVASRFGLNVQGVLLAAKSRGFLPTVQPILDELIGSAGFWVSPAVYRQTLQIADEE